ncbi:hypothetical protein F5148DRAFT_984480 [Russula earlei]|uniref:Uncharacterized protein n=1 Tax=Russula earlei TaxID=71964 RepID=A0ACC0U1P9_9AGAM|nr:hypothetical protein F5148DRAFT_984480 [Russula earlei]
MKNSSIFYDKFERGYPRGRNVGFRNWHPVPCVIPRPPTRLAGAGTTGGVWEWTSILKCREGFEPSSLYLAFPSELFDVHHNVVIGGSYATILRQAEQPRAPAVQLP